MAGIVKNHAPAPRSGTRTFRQSSRDQPRRAAAHWAPLVGGIVSVLLLLLAAGPLLHARPWAQ